MFRVIIDTNVPVVANLEHESASPDCVLACTQKLQDVQQHGVLVLDDGWLIIQEYQSNLRASGQPGVGDAFFKWILTHQCNPHRCEQVSITPGNSDNPNEFLEYPNDEALTDFDWSDRKFVAVAVAHPQHPSIANATDSDWWYHRAALERHNIVVDFLCPEMMPSSDA